MKNFFLITLFSFSIVTTYPLDSYAETETDFNNLESYATTEDIFLSMMKPKLTKILQNELGINVTWNYNEKGIGDIKLILDKSTPKWYEVSFWVDYELKEGFNEKTKIGKANVKIKIIPASFKNKYSEDKIELINFNEFYKE